MPRLSSRSMPLRGSVTQNTRTTVRLRPQETTRSGFLLRLGILAGAALFLVLLGVWLFHIGWPQKETQKLADYALGLTEKAGFAVRDITVEGRTHTSKDALEEALGTGAGASLLAFDPTAAEVRIAKLPWVAEATVERRLPDGIFVVLKERVPLARWQHENHTVVIDADGKELPGAKADQFSNLPLIVGEGAPDATAELLTALKDYPAITNVLTSAVRVGGRRWDLYLKPQIVAELPESDTPTALRKLSDLIAQQKILDRAIIAIDLRLPDREIFEPAPAAKESEP